MKKKFLLFQRGKVFYSLDSETGKRESLETSDRPKAKQIIHAKNDAATRPVSINLTLTKTYLLAAYPKLMERTWSLLMEEFCSIGKESTRLRRRRAIKSSVYDSIRNKKLIETTGDDLRLVLKSGRSSINHTLRCLHNLGLSLGWMLIPLIPAKLWPETKKRPQRAITAEEHQRIIQAEQNPERKLYYELLW